MLSDRTWLQRMLMNFLTNACKFTQHGNIDINVHMQAVSLELQPEPEPNPEPAPKALGSHYAHEYSPQVHIMHKPHPD